MGKVIAYKSLFIKSQESVYSLSIDQVSIQQVSAKWIINMAFIQKVLAKSKSLLDFIQKVSESLFSKCWKISRKQIRLQGQVWYVIVSISDLCTLTYFIQWVLTKSEQTICSVYSVNECGLNHSWLEFIQ